MGKCESCKPTTSENEWTTGTVTEIETGKGRDTGIVSERRKKCQEEYQQVENCMKQSQGSISKCNLEWIQFRKCFNANKE
jgi:hypothetical protein